MTIVCPPPDESPETYTWSASISRLVRAVSVEASESRLSSWRDGALRE